jgi:hypothetical protein
MKKLLEIHQKITSLVMLVIVFLAQLLNLAKLLPDNTTNILAYRNIKQSWSNRVICLPYSITVQIPICPDHRMEDSIDLIQLTIALMTRCFSGTKISQSLGTYEGQASEIINDLNCWIESYSTFDNFQTHLPFIIQWVQEIGVKLEQESMIVIVNRQARLIFMNNNEQHEINV